MLPGRPRLEPATVPDGIIGALVGMQIPEAAAREREAGYPKGSVLVTVRVYEGFGEARFLLEHQGGRLVEP